ncbi:hypothetical protein CROQUDRAFT_650350 [Cronartium quercuum f. sp. fusiforme G11]|uniref:LsmAD domain-containing protein n=1 Tax=Cronartium quercuum f. sp. fusiforme G11 TaxID=708437 RepID=A0A9P6TI01_9BASI|nr:hypothetical protein CROQUDRAFT_650350 [Cronartium quercuum f. sp. fusiforme G11]
MSSNNPTHKTKQPIQNYHQQKLNQTTNTLNKKNNRPWNYNPNPNQQQQQQQQQPPPPPPPPNAWRNSSSNSNGPHSHPFVNGAIVGQQQQQQQTNINPHQMTHQQPATNDEKLVLKAMHERMVWFIISLVGFSVTATTKSGQRFQGLLSSAVTEAEFCITLKRAVELPLASTSSSPAPRTPPTVKSTLIILAKELVEVVANDIDLEQASSIGAGVGSFGGFKTDAETSGPNGNQNVREKQLQTWQPSSGTTLDDDGMNTEEHGLEDSLFPKTEAGSTQNRRTFDKPWDQFEANEKLFGTRTDFDEEIYTTKLDRTAKDFKERERKAEALAREIMTSSSSNPHVQEERGLMNADDSGMNEEDKYGAVVRSEGAYVPPGARKAAAAAAAAASGNNRGTLHPMPSNSSLNKVQQTATYAGRTARNTMDGPPPPPSNESVGKPPVAPATQRQQSKGSPSVSGPSGDKNGSTTTTPSRGDILPRPTVTVQQPSSSSIPTTSNLDSTLLSKSSSAAPPKVHSTTPSKQPDEVAPRFKAFVTDEKERLQQKKKDLLKKEKESRLAEFKAFSASFKLPMAVPKDLEPIIKKPSTNSTVKSAEPSKQDPTKVQDEGSRRASVTASNVQMQKSMPPNLQQLTQHLNRVSLAQQSATKPVGGPTTVGSKKGVALAAIPPFKPRNQAIPESQRNVTFSVEAGKKDDQQSGSSGGKSTRFVNIPPIPPFKPKVSTSDSNNNATASGVTGTPKLSTKAAAFNPAAKTFTPGPAGQPSTSGRKPIQNADTNSGPPNPFFGSRPIKKGSSSMHVKEEFTPFRSSSSSVPEASSVGPAWPFSGKSYRQMFGPNVPPTLVPHLIHHPPPHPQHHHPIAPPPMHIPLHAHHPPPMMDEEGVVVTAPNGMLVNGPAAMVLPAGYLPPPPPPPQQQAPHIPPPPPMPPYIYPVAGASQQPPPGSQQQQSPQSPYNGSYRGSGNNNNGGNNNHHHHHHHHHHHPQQQHQGGFVPPPPPTMQVMGAAGPGFVGGGGQPGAYQAGYAGSPILGPNAPGPNSGSSAGNNAGPPVGGGNGGYSPQIGSGGHGPPQPQQVYPPQMFQQQPQQPQQQPPPNSQGVPPPRAMYGYGPNIHFAPPVFHHHQQQQQAQHHHHQHHHHQQQHHHNHHPSHQQPQPQPQQQQQQQQGSPAVGQGQMPQGGFEQPT